MSLLFIGMTLGVLGKGLIALAVVWVHVTMANERSIDDLVIRSFRTELFITIFGFALIVLGYTLEVIALGGFGELTACVGGECQALLLKATNN